jgi:hypothetical protein
MNKDTLRQANALQTKIDYWEKKKEQFPKYQKLLTYHVGAHIGNDWQETPYKDWTKDLIRNHAPVEPEFYEMLLEEVNRTNHFMRTKIQLKIDELELELDKL